MVQLRTKSPMKVVRLLQSTYPGATVEFEKVQGTRRHNFLVVSEKFSSMREWCRIRTVWQQLGDNLSTTELMHLGMVMPLKPDQVVSGE